MIKAIILIIIALISTAIYSQNQTNNSFCQHYDWAKVENLVEPYLNENMMTTLIQQGISAEYNTSMAADQALGSAQFPISVETILIKLSTLNCQ